MSHPVIPDPVDIRRGLDFLFRAGQASGIDPTDAVSSGDNPLSKVAAVFVRTMFIVAHPSFWKRVGVGALGMLLIYWGILVIIGSLDITQRAVEAVATKGMSEVTS